MIALISDTHENEEAMKKAVALIKKRKVAFTIHLGDIVSPPVLMHFKGLKMKILYGNNDGEELGLRTMSKKLKFEGPFEELEFSYLGKKFYAYHGTDSNRLNHRIFYGGYDYVLTGHTHKKRDEKVGGTRVINPGALFRCTPYTIAFLDVEKDSAEFVEISRE
jgi:uncharacterized protein